LSFLQTTSFKHKFGFGSNFPKLIGILAHSRIKINIKEGKILVPIFLKQKDFPREHGNINATELFRPGTEKGLP
jgi:hypothetical protein